MTGGTYRDDADAEELGLVLQGAVGDVVAGGRERTGTPRAHCAALPVHDSLDFHDWPLGAEVTLQIDDPRTGPGQGPGPDYTASGFTEVAPWDPDQTMTGFNFKEIQDLQPGHLITCSDAGFTKEHRVTGLAILAVDPESDIVRGVATAGSELSVYANPPDEEAGTSTTAGPDGNWAADFGGLFDIDAGTKVEAEESDDDGDSTHSVWE